MLAKHRKLFVIFLVLGVASIVSSCMTLVLLNLIG